MEKVSGWLTMVRKDGRAVGIWPQLIRPNSVALQQAIGVCVVGREGSRTTGGRMVTLNAS